MICGISDVSLGKHWVRCIPLYCGDGKWVRPVEAFNSISDHSQGTNVAEGGGGGGGGGSPGM